MGLPSRSFVVVSTRYVVPPPRFGEPPYYEIILGQDHDADAPRLTVITRDEILATRAIDLEGSDIRVSVNWHSLQAPRVVRRVLEAIA